MALPADVEIVPGAKAVGSVTAEIIRVVHQRADRLVERSASELLDAEATYRSLVPEDELRSMLRQNIDLILLALAGEPVGDTFTLLPGLIGRRRAEQGVPLEAVLHSFRIDFRVVWSAMLAEASSRCPDRVDAFLGHANRLWEIIDASSSAVSLAYRGAEADMAQRHAFQRQLVLSALLYGTDPPAPIARELTSELRFTEGDTFVVVCAEHDDAADAPGLLRPTTAMRAAGFLSAWCANGSMQLGIVQIGQRPTADVVTSLRALARARVGVGPPFAGLQHARGHVWLATAALHGLPKGTASVGTLDEHLMPALLGGSPELSLYMAAEVLAPLFRLRDTQRERILQTFRVYIEGSGSATETARALHYHRNSVLNHLQALETLTGRSVHSPRQLTELVLAVTALDLLERNDKSAGSFAALVAS
jgi:PucR-like helix-turn-helix protein